MLETVLYFRDQASTRDFYSRVMGMRLLSEEPGRSLFLRAGPSVFLMFDAAETRKGGFLPPHGTDGAGHTCFVVDPDDYQPWKDHLSSSGVEVIKEVQWPRGRSFYFSDPSGNLLEIADADIWPR